MWRFNLRRHFDETHSGQICPPIGVISEDEKNFLLKKKNTSKNAMNSVDTGISNLNESQLQMLPFKDFWNVKKKEWTKSPAGLYGKRHSELIKKLFGKEKFQ